MSIELNHTIVHARDPKASAQFLADILGLEVDPPVARFTPVTLANRVTLDYLECENVAANHYAFLVGDPEFEAAFSRIRGADLTYYADPGCTQPGQTYQRGASRGVYFRDPNGHLMEVLTPDQ